MKRMKIGVMLLALLLAGMAMVPMASAVDTSDTQDVLSNSLANETTTYHGDTLKVVKWVDHPINASNVNESLTREEFISTNKEYINWLAKNAGQEAAEKVINEYYSENMSSNVGIMAAPDPTNIKQILNKDVYLWAYESKMRDLYDTNADPISFVVLGNTNDEFANFLTSNGWSRTGFAYIEFGYRGSGLSSLNWDLGAINMIKQTGDNRYHCTIHSGAYSTILQDDWSYGECHYEQGIEHTMYPGAITQGSAYLYDTVGSSYNKYSSNLGNSNTFFDGNGYVYKVRS